jgi:hypothetical protein
VAVSAPSAAAIDDVCSATSSKSGQPSIEIFEPPIPSGAHQSACSPSRPRCLLVLSGKGWLDMRPVRLKRASGCPSVGSTCKTTLGMSISHFGNLSGLRSSRAEICHAAFSNHVLDQRDSGLMSTQLGCGNLTPSSKASNPVGESVASSFSLTASSYQHPALPSSPQHHCQTSTQPASQTPSRPLRDHHPLSLLSSCA